MEEGKTTSKEEERLEDRWALLNPTLDKSVTQMSVSKCLQVGHRRAQNPENKELHLHLHGTRS